LQPDRQGESEAGEEAGGVGAAAGDGDRPLPALAAAVVGEERGLVGVAGRVEDPVFADEGDAEVVVARLRR
jgi:hypothetical protein